VGFEERVGDEPAWVSLFLEKKLRNILVFLGQEERFSDKELKVYCLKCSKF
jgi:hypothetical protein